MKNRKQVRREAKRIFLLCLTDGQMNEDHVRTVVKRISESEKHERFALLTQFRRMVNRKWINQRAVVQSAAPLPDALAESVRSDLVSRYGRGLSISFADAPWLIGGLRITVGSDVYDGSVRARLNALESRM